MFNDPPVPVEYGGFWIRFWAAIVDGFAAMPVALAFYFLFELKGPNPIAASVTALAITLSFEVLLVAKYGGSPGKLAAGLRIRDVSLGEASARQAFIRALPNIMVALLRIASTVVVVQALGPQLQQLSGRELDEAVRAATPGWTKYLGAIAGCWFIAEFVSMMSNDQRRALHDKIAGTVVIKAASLPALDQQTLTN
jgi:uncharacterized RDD family membrane protein YckC